LTVLTKTVTKLWGFSSLVPLDRSQDLLAVADFGEVIDRIRAGSIEFIGAEPRRYPPCVRCYRASFKVHLCERDYDAFFNAPTGYRAQYAIGVENGEASNRELLKALEPTCLETANRTEQDDLTAPLVAASLRATGAKLWIQESDLDGLSGVHIEYRPWLDKLAAESSGTMADQAARAAASAGVLAPIGTVLEIKGGWIAPNGIECRDPAKANRSQEIHDYGFS
jgi:hypothetical protein